MDLSFSGDLSDDQVPAVNFMASAPTMRPIGSPMRNRRSQCISPQKKCLKVQIHTLSEPRKPLAA